MPDEGFPFVMAASIRETASRSAHLRKPAEQQRGEEKKEPHGRNSSDKICQLPLLLPLGRGLKPVKNFYITTGTAGGGQ